MDRFDPGGFIIFSQKPADHLSPLFEVFHQVPETCGKGMNILHSLAKILELMFGSIPSPTGLAIPGVVHIPDAGGSDVMIESAGGCE